MFVRITRNICRLMGAGDSVRRSRRARCSSGGSGLLIFDAAHGTCGLRAGGTDWACDALLVTHDWATRS